MIRPACHCDAEMKISREDWEMREHGQGGDPRAGCARQDEGRSLGQRA